ncbi:MAG: DUF2304 domain-containing protein [Termitinemataceae bacterium]|nr:MAG: DUF2304 domain-containing protein [Termitinemataceae bacterium]
MNSVLQIFLIACLLAFLAIIIRFLTKKRMNLKYSLVWLFADTCMLIVAIFPKLVDIAGAAIGIATPVNTVFLFAGIFMLMIILTLTMIVSHLNNKIYKLTQTLALLEKRVRYMESKPLLIPR